MKYLVSLLLILSVKATFACTPAPPEPALKEWYVIERYNEADLIVRGKFKNINIIYKRILSGSTFVIKDRTSSNIIVTGVHKGKLPTTLLIDFKTLFCGQSVDLDTEYLIYAAKHNNNTYAFTEAPIPIEYAETDLKVLKEIKYKFTNPKTATKSMYQKP